MNYVPTWSVNTKIVMFVGVVNYPKYKYFNALGFESNLQKDLARRNELILSLSWHFSTLMFQCVCTVTSHSRVINRRVHFNRITGAS